VSLSPRFLALLEAEGLEGKRALDIGCGAGRLTVWLAPRVKHAVGLDRDPRALADARRLAGEADFTNVEFHEADVEREEYARWRPDLVTAYLCASDAIVERAGRALAPGQCLAMVAFHVDQWRETGKVSRFAYDESRMERVLRASGFLPEVIEVESDVLRFASVEEGLAAAVGLEDKWRSDGRWFRYIAFLEEGGRTLTRAHLIVKARRP
jgi:SAM-dependent methyltransferases related to tRNA (uracil-5-)-methyltransferase